MIIACFVVSLGCFDTPCVPNTLTMGLFGDKREVRNGPRTYLLINAPRTLWVLGHMFSCCAAAFDNLKIPQTLRTGLFWHQKEVEIGPIASLIKTIGPAAYLFGTLNVPTRLGTIKCGVESVNERQWESM